MVCMKRKRKWLRMNRDPRFDIIGSVIFIRELTRSFLAVVNLKSSAIVYEFVVTLQRLFLLIISIATFLN